LDRTRTRPIGAMAASKGPGPEAWEYDVLATAETGGVSLRHIAFGIFRAEGLVEAFGVPEERFKALLERLELLYSVENPYHCALHAAVRVMFFDHRAGDRAWTSAAC